MKENFIEALAIFGLRKTVRSNWLNNKDEFYLSAKINKKESELIRMGAIYALIDGGCSGSLSDLSFKKETDAGKVNHVGCSFRNEFFLLSKKDVQKTKFADQLEKDPYTIAFLESTQENLSQLELNAISATKQLLLDSLKPGLRAKPPMTG